MYIMIDLHEKDCQKKDYTLHTLISIEELVEGHLCKKIAFSLVFL